MKREEFITKKPKDPLLTPYISYYYFHRSLDDSLQKSFIYYPGIKNALTIYKGAQVEYGENYSSVSPSVDKGFIFIYSGVQKHFRKAFIAAPFDKIGVVFNELGINHFLNEPLSQISNDAIDKSFNYFETPFIDQCQAIYKTESIEQKVKLLDQFFTSRFNNLDEVTLKKAVKMIINASEKITVKHISDALLVNRKTLLRLFNKHLGCTVKDYIDIVQFRKSLNSYLIHNNKESLTGLALENDYYDQSQFINHFKRLTGTNPKDFFKNIEHVGMEDTFWTFR